MGFKIVHQTVQCVPSEKPQTLHQIQLSHDVDLYYVVPRFKRGRSKNQVAVLGDNCPFLYGLKQLDGLSVEPQFRAMFYEIATQSVRQHFQNHLPFDYLVLLPSSHSICQDWVAQFDYDVPVLNHIFRKKHVGEIQEEMNFLYQNGKVNQKIYEIITQKCGAAQDIFSLKHIPVAYRRWVQPFALNQQENTDLSGKRILLVDDICSSGSSLLQAADLLKQAYCVQQIAALTLFGKVPA